MDTYEKKLALTKEALDSGSYDKETIEYIFPELKESEDERIRKELLAVIDDLILPDEQKERFVAWLEAQGEQKPLGFNIGDEITVNGQICKVVAVEQKPAEWNEKDDSHIYSITEKLKGKFEKSIVITKFSLEEDLSWLKSLKNRVQPQPKQEWSEEDENRLSDAVFFVREYQIPTRDKRLLNAAKEAEEWLKSLRPYSQWKPSEGQKEALLWCVVHLGGADKQTLGELLEELNKL